MWHNEAKVRPAANLGGRRKFAQVLHNNNAPAAADHDDHDDGNSFYNFATFSSADMDRP